MASQYEMAQMSGYVYHDKGGNFTELPKGWHPLGIKLADDQNDTGFFAEAYENTKTGEVVIAYRGSDDFSKDWRTNLTEIVNYGAGQGSEPEINPLTGKRTLTQFDQAKAFYTQVLNHFKDTDRKISVTGHSLGGALAQVAAAHAVQTTGAKVDGATFAAPGMKDYIDRRMEMPKGYSSNLTHYYHEGDAVSGICEHYGNTEKISNYSAPMRWLTQQPKNIRDTLVNGPDMSDPKLPSESAAEIFRAIKLAPVAALATGASTYFAHSMDHYINSPVINVSKHHNEYKELQAEEKQLDSQLQQRLYPRQSLDIRRKLAKNKQRREALEADVPQLLDLPASQNQSWAESYQHSEVVPPQFRRAKSYLPGSYPSGSGQPMLPSFAPRTNGNKSYSNKGESGFVSVVPKPVAPKPAMPKAPVPKPAPLQSAPPKPAVPQSSAAPKPAIPTPATPKPVQAGPRPLKPLSEISTDPAQRSTADNDDLLQHKPWLSQGMGESRSMAEMAANLRQPITEPNKSIHSTDLGGTWLMPNDRKPDEPLEAWQDRMDKSRKAFVSQMYQDRKSYGFPV